VGDQDIGSPGRPAEQNCDLLGYYVASSGNSLPTFRDNLSVPSVKNVAVLFVTVACYCVYSIYSITLLPDFLICCDCSITKHPCTMLKRICKSSVMLRGDVAPDVSKDCGTFIFMVKPRTLTVICMVVLGAKYIGC
jgi:hypothetical protein